MLVLIVALCLAATDRSGGGGSGGSGIC